MDRCKVSGLLLIISTVMIKSSAALAGVRVTNPSTHHPPLAVDKADQGLHGRRWLSHAIPHPPGQHVTRESSRAKTPPRSACCQCRGCHARPHPLPYATTPDPMTQSSGCHQNAAGRHSTEPPLPECATMHRGTKGGRSHGAPADHKGCGRGDTTILELYFEVRKLFVGDREQRVVSTLCWPFSIRERVCCNIIGTPRMRNRAELPVRQTDRPRSPAGTNREAAAARTAEKRPRYRRWPLPSIDDDNEQPRELIIYSSPLTCNLNK